MERWSLPETAKQALNESSFSRIQLLLDKIYGMHELKGKLGFQRVMNVILLLVVAALVIGVIVQIFM